MAKGCDWLIDRTELYPLTHFFLRVHQSLVYLSIYSMQHDCENPVFARPRCGHAPVPTPTLVRGPRPPQGGPPPTVHALGLQAPPRHTLPPALFHHLDSAVGSQKARLAAAFMGAGHGEGNGIVPSLSSSTRTLHCRHLTTSATSAASSETGRFPVVSAPFPSATLYCKHRATLNEARWCPISAGGGGRLLCFSRGKHYRALPLSTQHLFPHPHPEKLFEEKKRAGFPF